MDRNDQSAIEGLFGKLAEVERNGPPRDGEAEAFIAQRMRDQPGAAYYMLQTIVVQERALEAAQARIEELEAGGRRGGGGLFDTFFGGGPSRKRSVPPPQPSAGTSVPRHARDGGGGFLAGAAQTAMGVAGGVLLGNALGGLFGGGEATAAEADADQNADDTGGDDSSFGFGDGGDFGE